MSHLIMVLKKRKCEGKVGDSVSNVFNQRTGDQCPVDGGFVIQVDDNDDDNVQVDDNDDDGDDNVQVDDNDDDDDDNVQVDDNDDDDVQVDDDYDVFNQRIQDQCPVDGRFVIEHHPHIPHWCAAHCFCRIDHCRARHCFSNDN